LILCKKKILRHIKLAVHAWKTKYRRNQKLIAQFGCTFSALHTVMITAFDDNGSFSWWSSVDMVVGWFYWVGQRGERDRRCSLYTGNLERRKRLHVLSTGKNIYLLLSPGNSDALLENRSMYFEGLCVIENSRSKSRQRLNHILQPI
jgi:hypothetical protein